MSENVLEVYSRLVNGKVKFSSAAGEKSEIITDYIPPLGEGKSYMPLELFLISFATCVGGTVSPLLRKLGKNVTDLSVQARGIRREQHPTCFEKIFLHITLTSPDAGEEDLQKAVALSEERFCPVWAMIKNNVEVIFDCQVVRES